MTATMTDGERTAYHEAGHAVAAYVLDFAIDEVSMIPTETSRGHIVGPARDVTTIDLSSETECVWVHRNIMLLLAGVVTEQCLGLEIEGRGQGDLAQAAELAGYVAGSEAETGRLLAWLWERTKNLVSNLLHWAAIEALASALLEHRRLSNRKARQVIREAMQGARLAGV